MWKKTYKQTVQGINPAKVWRLWTEINHWPAWQPDLDDCHLEGPFAVGSYFFLKPKGAKPVKIQITEVQEGHSFTDRTSFWGAVMEDTHTLEETPEGLTLSHTLTVTGPLKWLWVNLVAKEVARSVPAQTEALVRLARGLDE